MPRGGNHTTRTVFVGPDQHLYVSIGSDCNVCIESNKYRATTWRYNLEESGGEAYARGLRNAVDLALSPWNQQIWLTNNGRPVDVVFAPDGTLFISDDNANVVYHVWYHG